MPTIQTPTQIVFASTRVTCFTGENGSGKSTLLEAIASARPVLDGGDRIAAAPLP